MVCVCAFEAHTSKHITHWRATSNVYAITNRFVETWIEYGGLGVGGRIMYTPNDSHNLVISLVWILSGSYVFIYMICICDALVCCVEHTQIHDGTHANTTSFLHYTVRYIYWQVDASDRVVYLFDQRTTPFRTAWLRCLRNMRMLCMCVCVCIDLLDSTIDLIFVMDMWNELAFGRTTKYIHIQT